MKSSLKSNLNDESKKILSQLSQRQKEAVTYTDGHLLVLAGAGSGKTRVLTCKIAWLISEGIAKPYEILAMTFTNKAAGEMRTRINDLVPGQAPKIQAGTFHGFGLHFLFRNMEAARKIANLQDNFSVFDRTESRALIQDIMQEMNISTKKISPASVLDSVARDYMAWSALKTESLLDGDFLEISKEYRKRLRALNAVDFDDLMILPLEILSKEKEIRTSEQKRFRWILVDEYQDVNKPQYLLLKYLVGKNCTVNVVGDPDQSIYGWRGAEIGMILNFERDFSKAKTIVLDQNYRSTGNILEASNALIKNNHSRLEKNLFTSHGSGEKIYNLLAQSDYQEADFISREIKKLKSIYGYNYGDIAILYRQNSMSRLYEQKFLEENIPYRIVRGLAFYDRMEVRDVLSILKLALNPLDNAALERVITFAIEGMGAKRCAEFENWLIEQKNSDNDSNDIWSLVAGGAWKVKGKLSDNIRNFATHMCAINELSEKGISEAVDYVIHDLGYEKYLQVKEPETWEDRLDNVKEIKSVIPDGNLSEALAEAALYTDADTQDTNSDSVGLLTLHAAKGLEFPVVFIVGLEEDIFPHSRSKDSPEELEEERRLCYVGMTRAEERLYLTAARSRHLYGTSVENSLSRFLSEVPEELKKIDDRGHAKLSSYNFNNYKNYERKNYGSNNNYRRRWSR